MTDSPAREATSHGGDERARNALTVTTGARLHFGLLDTVPPFGGIGVMLDGPVTEVVVKASEQFRCEPELDSRIRPIARRAAQWAGHNQLPPVQVDVVRRTPVHCGLGSGTQLAMAVAEAICEFLGIHVEHSALASRIADRGHRSAIGAHGYAVGGLIYERSEQPADVNPICQRIELPQSWRVALVQPHQSTKSVSGEMERAKFSSLPPVGRAASDRLCQLIHQDVVPAAQSGDLPRFADAVQAYNRASGMLFQAAQGGPYNGRQITSLVESLQSMGLRGIGQSSWGPSVFTWFASPQQAEDFTRNVPRQAKLVGIAKPLNRGRQLVAR